MAAPPMDPQYEQRLRDEVIYLHSLWHQGPPSASAPVVHHHHLQPSNTTKFKKEKKRRGRRGKKGKKPTKNPKNAAAESNSSPGAEWRCPTPPPPPSTSEWPSWEAKSDQKPLSLSPEDKLKLAAKHAHHHALKAVREFFTNDDDSDEIDSSSEDDDDDELMEEDDEREESSFFFKVFKEDNGLREYYEKNFVKGEFTCLVCGALGGKKTGKRFKGCLALVQHSITIAKTKKRRAHREFGLSVCKVLGWDIDQLPSIVSLLSDKSDQTQENVNTDNNGEACPDADKNLENLGIVHPHNNMEEPAAEGLTSDSLIDSDGDKNLENLSVEEPVAEGFTSVPLNEDNNVNNETRHLQMTNPVVDEDNEK